jgi:hypothetical protein
MATEKFELNFFTSKYDNEVKVTKHFTWEQLCEKFSTHKITNVKNDEGFICAKFKRDNYRPATRAIYEEIDGEKVEVSREIKYDREDRTIIGRYAENIITYNCLVLDYDGANVKLEDKQAEFKGFRHIGYTSHNHHIKGVDKFRIILPFKEPCPTEDWRLRQDEFRTFAGVDDRSTTALARIFFSPTCPEAGLPYKQAWNKDGETLDWKWFAPKKVIEPVPLPDVPMSPTGMGKVRYETFDMLKFFKDRGMLVHQSSTKKHDVKCFREGEHHTNSPGGTCMWEGGGGKWPSFYCGHSHALTNKDFWEHYKKEVGLEVLNGYCQREEAIDTPMIKMLKYKLAQLQKLK